MSLRSLAIKLLDDDHGISVDAMEILADLLEDAGHIDIMKYVRVQEGRAYLYAGEFQYESQKPWML